MFSDTNKAASPLVSIVSPVFNCENYLEQFIGSIQAQTLQDWELIIVDDGSEDSSAEIAERYAAGDKRIRCIRSPHQNAGTARNTGIDLASGKYICFLDSDDWCRNEMLEKMLTAAEEHNADVVLCLADQYSEKNGTYKPISWTIVPKNIPETEDGCYNRHSNSAYLFQSAIVSPWNKMIRLDLIKNNNIRAQSQPSANDVVLACTALACAERIYPLYESLYIQRRDNVLSITGNLSSEEKHLCGYTASLGLLKELQRLGIYQEVRETYQRLAIHNCIWYLEKNFSNLDTFKHDYEFLQTEGFKNLDLENIHPSVLYYDPDEDVTKFTAIHSGTALYEFLYARIQQEKKAHKKELARKKDALNDTQKKVKEARKKINRLSRRISTLENTKSQKIIRFLYSVPSKIKRKLSKLFVSQKSRTEKGNKNNNPAAERRAAAEKRIAFAAFEDYHFEVVSNMISICNPVKNYIIAYVHPHVKEEVSKLIGSAADLIDWHDYTRPRLATCKGLKDYASIQVKFIEHIQYKKDIDMVILPSPEYHPNWYKSLFNKNKGNYRVISGVHNLNTVFFSEYVNQNVKSFFSKSDAYAVIDQNMKDHMVKNGIDKEIMVFPQIFDPQAIEKRESEKTVFVITGWVDEQRKDYQIVVDALRLIPEIHPGIKLVLLGRAKSEYAAHIIEQLEELQNTGLEFLSWRDFVPGEIFADMMNEADFLIAPVCIATENRGITEYYGKTKISGTVGDMIHYACPAIINKELEIPEALESSTCRFETAEDLAETLRKLSDKTAASVYQQEALKNSAKFLLEKYIW